MSERLGQDSAARFATHLVHAVTKLWPMERIDSTYFEYKRAVRLPYSLCTPATHIPTLYITLNHTNRAPQTSTSASTPVQQLPHCTLHRKYHALRNRSPFLPRLIQEPLRRRDPTSLIAQPGDYEAIPATIPSHVPQSRESYSIVSVSHSFPHIRSQDGTCFIKVTSKIQRVGNGSIINALQLSAWILHSAWVAFVSADAVQWAVLRVGT